MAILDSKQDYVLAGSGATDTSSKRSNSSPPSAIHLRLSPSLLEIIMSGSDTEQELELIAFGTEQPCITLRGEKYPLLHTTESSPHQLYRIGAGSTILHHVGNITSKMVSPADGHANTNTSAASRLKERREMEEARKTEHRTVMIVSPPTTGAASKGKSTSKLKLRPKALAHSATNSPLIRSRAGTPIDTGSMTNSPNLHLQGTSLQAQTPPLMSTTLPNTQSSSVKPSPLGGGSGNGNGVNGSKGRPSSPPTLRRRLMQILARGPLSRRTIVRLSHEPEPAVMTVLTQIAHAAPEEMQPSADAGKKFSGPVNRRTSMAGLQSASASNKGDVGANTVYILNDSAYRDVMIKDWAEYDTEERRAVSELMEAALKRMRVDSKADDWKRLYPDGRGRSTGGEGSDLSSASRNGPSSSALTRESLQGSGYSTSSSLAESPTKSIAEGEVEGVTKAASKKTGSSTMSRLQKAAKGKGSVAASKTSTRSTVASGSGMETRRGGGNVAEASAKIVPKEDHEDPLRKKDPKESTKIPSKSLSRTATVAIKAMSRKDIEYTDSSDDGNDGMQMDSKGLAAPLRRTPLKVDISPLPSVGTRRSSSSSPDGKRQRRGVGAGAALTTEPWLDVRNRGDWQRLAERFTRVYSEYAKERLRLQEEQRTIKAELEMAVAEQASVNRRDQTEIEKSGSKTTLPTEDEMEEGEASSTNTPARETADDAAADPTLYRNFGWRQGNKTGKTDSHPLSIEELQTSIRQLRDKEAQLGRMKSTLQSSKQALESVGA